VHFQAIIPSSFVQQTILLDIPLYAVFLAAQLSAEELRGSEGKDLLPL